ncbi:phosphate ABC transporter permease family protein [Acinetobacter haemolyticus]|uniref:phosphate ABC transporter permease family protein n=1 Tax=Acinetobacter haemolyticus TaxID=29430 RepID=UPI000C2B9F85|nr:phosphate ABC transporter permease family protein [Acinetobacter haemolyticus]
MNLLIIGVLLALVAIAYQIGLRKSRNLAGKGNNSAALHSRPGYYGALVALWCGIPAFLILLIWNVVEPTVLKQIVFNHIPATVNASLDESGRSVLFSRVQAIASGFGVTDQAATYELAAAKELAKFQSIGTFAKVAVYLEEFAPKNVMTDIIEVNINNLAAVPSIVFGLLGAAIFIGWMHLPISAPLVGGLVLSLMTLPTVIITTRASLKAVPPSIRQAALGLGASRVQTVFHHVLPLALPGILTGAIIGVAQALGETAPLLLIGMSAFVASVPASPLDQSTALPVQIFLWQGNELRNFFEGRTAAAIIVLLALMIGLNSLAIWLRKKFEVRW